MEKHTLSEFTVQNALIQEFLSSCLPVMPSYTPRKWGFEADVWAVMRSGRTREVEIKLTVGDFRVDRCKHRAGLWGCGEQLKYDLLAKGDDTGPCYFGYALTEEVYLKVKDEIPAWAGVWIVRAWGQGARVVRIQQPAKLLHDVRATPEMCADMERMAYWRFLRGRHINPTEKPTAEGPPALSLFAQVD